MAVQRSSTDGSCATTTLGGGRLQAASAHMVDIDENDALDRVAHQLAARIQRLRCEALEHTLEPKMWSTDIGDAQRATERAHPPPKRAPAPLCLLTDSPKRAHLASHSGGTRTLPPAPQRPGDGSQPVAEARRHPTRHHRDHRPAIATEVTPHGDLGDIRRLAQVCRPKLKSPPNAVTDEAETLTHRAPGTTAARTSLGADGVHRRKMPLPKLDVDRRNDDP